MIGQQANRVRVLLLVSGITEILLGIGHSIVGTLVFERPGDVTWALDLISAPDGLTNTVEAGSQKDLIVGVFLIAGTCWIIFGSMLVYLARQGVTNETRPFLFFVLAHQLVFLALMLVFLPFHYPAIAEIVVMAGALALAIRYSRS
jgi:hypothetical protein